MASSTTMTHDNKMLEKEVKNMVGAVMDEAATN